MWDGCGIDVRWMWDRCGIDVVWMLHAWMWDEYGMDMGAECGMDVG